MMGQDKLEGNWKKISGELKKQWGKITDDEFTQADGSRKKIVGLLQEKYGYAKDKAEEKLEDFLSDFSNNMAENFQQVKERAKEYSDDIGEYIQQRPLAAVLVAAGIGLALGAFLLK